MLGTIALLRWIFNSHFACLILLIETVILGVAIAKVLARLGLLLQELMTIALIVAEALSPLHLVKLLLKADGLLQELSVPCVLHTRDGDVFVAILVEVLTRA